jgi:hypothetical protein
MAQQQDHPLYMIIDAVDECNWPWDSNGTLHSYIGNTKVKLVITHRDVSTWELRYRHRPATRKLAMKPEFASDIIHEYATQRVQRMVSIAKTHLARQVVKQISESSDGLWLYARLMLDEVFNAAGLAREIGAPLLNVHQINSTYELDFVHRSAY